MKSCVRKEILVGVLIISVIFSMIVIVSAGATEKTEVNKNPKSPDIIYVGGTGPNNYTTIQEGIDAANSGDKVFVYSGTYYENVVIDKTINLIGEDRNTTIIDGSGTGDVIYISADWVNVSGFGVRNGYYYGICIYSSSNNQITNCVVYDNSIEGVHLKFSSYNQIMNCYIYNNWNGIYLSSSHNNSITNCMTYLNNDSGIYFYSSSENSVTDCMVDASSGDNIYIFSSSNNNSFSNCTITNSENNKGIYIGDSSDNTITNCNISNNSYGIYLSASSNNIISGNSVYNNSLAGILFHSSSNNNITNCNISNNYRGIYLAWSSNNHIANCMISQNDDLGIYSDSSSNNHIINCNISNNDVGLYLSDTSNNNTITDCTISKNNHGILIGSSPNNNRLYHNNIINNTYQASDMSANHWDNGTEGNYWDDYDGIDADGDGIGDTPYNINGGNNVDNYPLIEPVGTDTIKPKITITGVENNTYYNTNVTTVITIFDLNLNTTTITLNGADFTSGTMIIKDGTYTLFVQATDKMNNKAEQTVTFTIDKTPPTISLVLPDNNSVIKPGTVISFNIADDNLWNTSYCVDNSAVQYFSSFYDISTNGWKNGIYNIVVYAKDWGMNENTEMFTFTIDSILPNISLTSPDNNSIIKPGGVIDFEINDVHLNFTTYTLNNGMLQTLSSPYNINTAGWEDGKYNITVYADDLAGNKITKTFVFIIDDTKPNINITGVMNGSYYNTNVTLFIIISDAHLNTSENIITLDTMAFVSGTAVTSEGKHTLYVYAVDIVGNNASQTIIFTIDKTKPIITVSGVIGGMYYNTDVVPVIDVSDANLNTTSVTLNGNPFTNGTVVSVGDTYILVVQADDKAGNNANKTITFTIDKTVPTITITESSWTTKEKTFTMHWSTTANDVLYYEISTDGVNWVNVSTGTSHTFTLSKGENTLYVRGTDNAGNTGTADMITVTYQEKTGKPGIIPGFETAALLFVLGICIILLKRKKFH